MLKITFILAALSLSVCAAQVNEPGRFERAQGIYDQHRKKIEVEFQIDHEQAKGVYLKSLESTLKRAKAAGALEAVLVLDKEIRRFRQTAEARMFKEGDVPETVRSMQSRYMHYVDEMRKEQNHKILRLSEQYVNALKPMQVEWTKQGLIEQAIRIRDEVQRIEQDPVVAEAYDQIVQQERISAVIATPANEDLAALSSIRDRLLAAKLAYKQERTQETKTEVKTAGSEWNKAKNPYYALLATDAAGDSIEVKAAKEACRRATAQYEELLKSSGKKDAYSRNVLLQARAEQSQAQTLLEHALGHGSVNDKPFDK